MITTIKGRNLLAKAQTGVKLKFTKVVFGDGLPDDSAILEDKEKLKDFLKNSTDLINPKMTAGIQSIEVVGDGTSIIKVVLSNADLDKSFFISEIGVYALDPDDEEILYSVDNFGNEADFMPAKGGTWVVEQELNLITIIGNAENVTAVINDSMAFATKEDLSKLKIELDKLKTAVTSAQRRADDAYLLAESVKTTATNNQTTLQVIQSRLIDFEKLLERIAKIVLPEEPGEGGGEIGELQGLILGNAYLGSVFLQDSVGATEISFMLDTSPLTAPGDFALFDNEGSGETVNNMTDNPATAGENDIILVE